MTDFFELGQILKPQGIKGEVKFDAFTDDLSRFSYLKQAFFRKGGNYEPVEVEAARVDARYAYLKLKGYDDRNAAEALRGTLLYIDRAHAARLPEGAYYVCDLLGLAVEDDEGNKLGILKDILQNGAADVYTVEKSGKLCMFPAIPEVVLKKDVGNGRIVVNAKRLSEVCVYDDI
ncbi:ribosome maturation factor RimM [Christensenellaceae bacterium]|nr:ribosome maturation factor RimM [Christensenellaceae bacterium]BDF61147.1 ribosome maturation factor RimM [Christensenellaceae bacterium]